MTSPIRKGRNARASGSTSPWPTIRPGGRGQQDAATGDCRGGERRPSGAAPAADPIAEADSAIAGRVSQGGTGAEPYRICGRGVHAATGWHAGLADRRRVVAGQDIRLRSPHGREARKFLTNALADPTKAAAGTREDQFQGPVSRRGSAYGEAVCLVPGVHMAPDHRLSLRRCPDGAAAVRHAVGTDTAGHLHGAAAAPRSCPVNRSGARAAGFAAAGLENRTYVGESLQSLAADARSRQPHARGAAIRHRGRRLDLRQRYRRQDGERTQVMGQTGSCAAAHRHVQSRKAVCRHRRRIHLHRPGNALKRSVDTLLRGADTKRAATD